MSDNYELPGPSSTKKNGRSQRRSSNKKKGRSAAFWVGVALAITALLTLITCGAYFGYYLNRPYDEDPIADDPEEPITTTTQGPLVTRTRPPVTTTTTTTKAPITTKPRPIRTCYERQSYKWFRDVMIPTESDPYRISVFSGLVTHNRMLTICDRINRNSRANNDTSYGALVLNSEAEETRIDTIIRKNHKDIFEDVPADRRLLWTGIYYKWYDYNKEWFEHGYQKMTDVYNNFCNRSIYSATLNKLKADQKETIYLVKDFRDGRIERRHACWQLYTSTQLLTIMDQPVGTIPRLPFVCMSKNSTDSSGLDAMPGHFKPKYPSIFYKDKYVVYGVSATFEDAVKECKSNGDQYDLVTIEDEIKLNQVESVLRESKHQPRNLEYDRMWTKGYVDSITDDIWMRVTPVDNRIIEMKMKYSDQLFKSFKQEQFNVAMTNLQRSIQIMKSVRKSNELDCEYDPDVKQYKTPIRSHLYVGMENNNQKKGLTIINPDGNLNTDMFSLYVLCQKY